MPDVIEFIFDGKLADEHRMDFYEASRFQYSAARLAVKLDLFRRTGRFPARVARSTNTQVELRPYREGSFGIEILAPAAAVAAPLLIELPLTSLWTYVVERVFKPADDANIREALSSQRALMNTFDDHIAAEERRAEATPNLLRGEQLERRELSEENRALAERLLSEVERRAYLEGRGDQLRQITAEQDAKLVTMAAPLLRDLAIPLRRSASRATIRIHDDAGSASILSADRSMAEEVELSTIDPNITPLRLNIIQFNKENGWGKFRNPEWQGVPSFSIPADRKAELQPQLLEAMKEDSVFVQAYFVRSMTGEKLRLIIVDFIDDEFEDL